MTYHADFSTKPGVSFEEQVIYAIELFEDDAGYVFLISRRVIQKDVESEVRDQIAHSRYAINCDVFQGRVFFLVDICSKDCVGYIPLLSVVSQ